MDFFPSKQSRYLKAYLIGSVVGIASELIVSEISGEIHHCIKNPTTKCLLSASIFNIYGWGTLLATYIFDSFNGKMSLPIILLTAIIISAFECISGKVSKIYHNGKQTWNYDDNLLPLCDGYVSLVSTFYFMALLILYYYYVYPKIF